jgi:hypothetical protein
VRGKKCTEKPENWELRRLFGPEREEVTGGWRKLQETRIMFYLGEYLLGLTSHTENLFGQL